MRGLSDAEINQGLSVLNEIIAENIGMSMIFTLVQAAKDWLKDRVGGGAIEEDPEVARKRAEAEEEARRQAARAHGTMVTRELFLAWKSKFDAEMGAIKASKQVEAQSDPEKANRLSGKAYFMNLSQQGDGVDTGLDEEEEEGEEEEEEEELEEEEDEDEDWEEDEDDDESFLEEIAKT